MSTLSALCGLCALLPAAASEPFPSAGELALPSPPSRLSLTQRYSGPPAPMGSIVPSADGWLRSGLAPVHGITIGPIESYLQLGRGYGTASYLATLDEVSRMGGNWISLTVFARMWDKKSEGIDLSFEQPSAVTRAAVIRAVQLAHVRGLRVLLVPHLWLESGEWRAELNPQTKEQWSSFVTNYQQFVLYWAEAAQESGVDLLAAGVELRSWVTTSRAPSFVELISKIRSHYLGALTYAANWDDADDTVIWGELDLIGINAFYPLHWEDEASYAQVVAGGERVRQQVEALAKRYERPVLFTEFGYTTRKNTEIKPWLWPEELGQVQADPQAQARAYEGLLGSMQNTPGFAGTVVWRMYADIADMSQEPDWGFSPWGKPAEQQLRRLWSQH